MKRIIAIILLCLLALTGCGKRTRDEKLFREQAIGFLENGDYGAAVARFNEALALSNGRYGRLEVDILKYKAEAEYMNGKYEDADKTYDKLIQFDGESGDYYNLRAICLAKANVDLKRALEFYHRADNMESDKTIRRQALYDLGNALAESEYESYQQEAESMYLTALDKESEKTGELYNRMGMMCFAKKDYTKAMDYFKQGAMLIKTRSASTDADANAAASEETEVLKSLTYNIAVCYEFEQEWEKALDGFIQYRDKYGTDEDLEHEIAFLESRVQYLREEE